MTRAMTPKAAQRRRSRFMERRASAASPGERMAAAVADYLAAVAHDEDKRRQLL